MAQLGIPPAFNPCPESIDCVGSDYPISNYSSEAPDQLIFFGLRWPGGAGKKTSGGTPGFWPPIGSTWTAMGCFGVVEAPTQAQADAQAEVLADTCVQPTPQFNQLTDGTWSATGCFGVCFGPTLAAVQALAQALEQFCMVDPNFTPWTIDGQTTGPFPNDPQTCTYTDGNGYTFTVTIPAGTIVASSLDLANQMAYSTACNQAKTKAFTPTDGAPSNTKIAWSNGTGRCCLGVDLTDQAFISVTGTGSPYTITDTGGTVPPGLELKSAGDTAWLSGATTIPGNYQFTIQITGSDGKTASKQYTMQVMGLTNPNLPQGTVGAAYSQKLIATGANGTVMFSLASGTLPQGLTLFSDGTLSGIPTATYP